jgi:hypothetical protein
MQNLSNNSGVAVTTAHHVQKFSVGAFVAVLSGRHRIMTKWMKCPALWHYALYTTIEAIRNSNTSLDRQRQTTTADSCCKLIIVNCAMHEAFVRYEQVIKWPYGWRYKLVRTCCVGNRPLGGGLDCGALSLRHISSR